MASDVLLIPDRGEIRWIDETVSPQSMSLFGNSQNQLNFVGYTSAFDATQTPTGGTTRVTINDSSTATLVPGASGYELGSGALRWSLKATAISATGIVSLSNPGGAAGPQLFFASASAPSSPSDGDMWYSGSALNFHQSGVTYNLLGTTIGNPVHSGTTGSILFVGALGALAQDNANLFWDDTNNRLGIGNATPQLPVDIRLGASGLLRAVNTNSTGLSEGATLILSQANVGLVVNGNRLGGILIGGASGTNYVTQNNAVAIQGYAAQTWTFGSVQGSYLTFETTPLGSATRTERMRIDPDATVWIGNGTISAAPEAAIISATRGQGTNIAGANLTIRSGAGTGTGNSGQLIFQTATPGSSGTGLNAYTNRMTIASNGTIVLIGGPGTMTWTASTAKLNIDGNGDLDHVTISQGGVESIALGHSSVSGSLGGRIYGSGEESGGLEIASVSNIQVVTGASGGLEMYPRGTSAGDTGELRFRELAANGTHHIALKAADALANSVIYVLPSAQPVANQVLTASSVAGAGPYTVTLGWTSLSSGGITSLNGETGAIQTFANDTNVTISSSTNVHTLGWTGQLAVSRGGTGASTLTSNGVLLGNGTSAISATAAGTANQVLRIPGGGGTPAFGAIDLSQSAAVTGTLGVTNGGTGTATQFTQNNVVFAGASGVYSQSNAFTFTLATGQLALSTTGSGAGILIGGDVQLYRSGANILGVPDTVEIRSANALRFNNAGDTKFSSFVPGAQTVTINYTLPSAAPALNDVLKATSVSGTDPVTVTLGWVADTDTGITSLNGQTGATQTFANDTNVTISSATNTHSLGWTGQLAVSRGGTGAGTLTTNGVLLGNGTSAISATAAGTANQVLRIPGGGGAPAFGAIDLAQSAAVTGILGVANGGTGTSTQFTQNNIVFAGASGVYTQSSNFTYNTSTGQFAIATTGSGAGILIGGDTQLYRDAADVLRTPDSLRVDTSIAINTSIPANSRFSAAHTTTSLSTDYTTLQSIVTHTVNTPDTAINRAWAMQFTATQSGSGTFNDASTYGAMGLEGGATYSGSGSSVGVTGGAFVARNTGTGTLTQANGIVIPMSSVNTGGGHITNLLPLDITWATDFSATNQTRMAIRIGAGPTNAGSFGGSIVGGIWFNSNSGTAVDGIIWGTSADVNLYRSAANILSTDDNFEIRGGLALRMMNASNTKYSSFALGSQAITINYTLPRFVPAVNDVLRVTNTSGTDPVTVTLAWGTPNSGITSLGGQTGATQAFANDTNVTISSATNTHTLGWTGQLAVSRGGTGASTLTSNGVLLGNGTSAIAATAAGTANQVLRVPGAGGAPAFGAIDLAQAAAVTGTLGVTNGGTGTATQFTQNNVVFAGASGVYSQSNAFTFTSATGQLALSTTGSGAGILIGGDVQLYRSGANILGLPDIVEIRSANALRFNNAGDTKFSSFAPGAQTVTINYTLPATAPALNDVLKVTSVSGTDPATVTLGWVADTDTGITSLNGQTGTTQTFANDTNVTISSATNTHTLGWTGQLAVSRGGTGASTLTSNGVLLGNGTSAISATAAGTANQVLRIPSGGGAPAFGAIDLSQSAAVTGTLGATNGGTGTATQFTTGSVVFAGASGVYTQDNANYFWDNTNKRLGLGTASPGATLHVNPATGSQASWLTSGVFLQVQSGTRTNSSTAGSGTAASAVFSSFAQPTLAASNASVTTTDAATVYIANAPAAGANMTITNAYALWVDDGSVRFDGQLLLPTTGSGAGILIGGDVQLYRSAANILGVLDAVEIRSANALRFNNAGDTKFSSFAPGAQTVTINYTLPTAAPALNDVLKATSVSGTDPVTVTLSWASDTDTGIISLNGQTGATQTFTNDTNVTISSATNTHTLGWTGQLAVSRGGTGASTLTSNGVLLGNGTSAISATAAGTANQVLRIPSGGGAPAFGAIDLAQAAAVTGILGVANGGTGTSTAFTSGSVVFAGTSGVYSQNNTDFSWDNSISALSLRTSSAGTNPLLTLRRDSQTSNHSGLVLRNNTVSTSFVSPAQVPPSIEFFGNDWTTSGTPGNRNIRTRLSQVTDDLSPGIIFSQSIDTGTASYNAYASLTPNGLWLFPSDARLTFGYGSFIKEDSTSASTVIIKASNGVIIQEGDVDLTLAEFQTIGNKMYGGSTATVLKLINNIGGNAEFFSIWDVNDSTDDNRRFSVGLISGVYATTLYPYDTLAGSTTELRFKELLANGSNHIAFKAPDSITQDVTYILPATQPAANQVLRAASVSGAGPYTVTLGWVNDADTGITSLGGQTGITQTFANDTNVTISSSANTHTLGWTGQLAVSRGGTGAGTFTANGVLLGNGTSAIGVTAAGTANQVLRIPGAGGAPTFGAIDLAQSAAVTGILPVANGGTGTSTAFTTGSVVFAGTSGVYNQDNANYFWDNTNKRLGLGTASPGATLHVSPATGSQASWLTDGAFFRVQAGTRTNSSTATSGTAASAVFASFGQPTLAATNTGVTTTDAATVYIANAPANGTNMTITNPYALWVDAGQSRFDDPIGVGINPVADTMIYGNITTSSNLTRRGIFGYNTVTGAITSAFPVGVTGRLDVNAGANTISYVAGITGSMRTQSGQSGTVTEAYGIDVDAWHAGTSGVTSLVCGRAFTSVRNTSGGTISNWAGYLVTLDMQSGGTNSAVTSAFGFDFGASLAGASTITNLAGYRVQNPTGSQTITNFYGIRINDLTRGTNNYGIYFDGTSGLARQGIWWNADTNLYRSAADTLKTDDELVVGRRISTGVVVLTDGANISLDASLGNHFRVTLGGNRTLLAPTNAVDGQRITIEVIQDGTGSRTLTLTTGSSGAFIFGTDITAITLTTTANKRDLIGCVYSSSLARWLVVSFVKGF